jgi:hypothetical protein
MHLAIGLFLVYILFSFCNGSQITDAVKIAVLTSQQQKRQLEQDEKKNKDKKTICNHLVSVFQSEINTCPVFPIRNYRDLYMKHNAHELWEYQRRFCNTFVRESRVGKFILFVIAFGTVLFMFSGENDKSRRNILY